MPDTPPPIRAASNAPEDIATFLSDATALSRAEQAELACSLATRGDGAVERLAARLLSDWDGLSGVARTAGLVILASALSRRGR